MNINPTIVAPKFTEQIRQEVNGILQKYNGWLMPQALNQMWQELQDIGIEINGFVSSFHTSYSFTYKGQEVDNHRFIYKVYRPQSLALSNEYTIYIS